MLADEINRAPAKVQSALSGSDGRAAGHDRRDHASARVPLTVLATQNPIEREKARPPLPEAQLDRFLFKVKVDYPTLLEEKTILDRMAGVHTPKPERVCRPERILKRARPARRST